MSPDPDSGGLLVYGEVANNTGSAQELVAIVGKFYDAQGNVIADANRALAYWPLDVVLPGGRMPFEITLVNVQSVANFDLSISAQPTEEAPRQDFELSALAQSNEGDAYCVQGKVRNPGDALQSYLGLIAILYDSPGNVINFGDVVYGPPFYVVGDRTLSFKICVTPPNQNVARYELRAWGR